MKVRTCMTTNPVAAPSVTRLGAALELMTRHALRHLPVIEADGTFVGIVRDHDIRAVLSEDGEHVLERGVLSIATVGSPTLGGDSSVDEAWALLSRLPAFNPMPVVTGGKLEGTVSQHELLRALAGLPPLAEPVIEDEGPMRGFLESPLIMPPLPHVSFRGVGGTAEPDTPPAADSEMMPP
jgi:acetoin utilization protein AcuB